MDHLRSCALLETELDRLAASVGACEPTAPVPSCPGWDVAKLCKHLGTVHRWATALVAARSPERLDPRSIDLELPSEPGQWGPWLDRGGRELVAVLSAADADDAMYAWGADQHVRFWSRRQLHETAVHRADLDLTSGRPVEFDPEVAVDGIDEFLDNLPAAWRQFGGPGADLGSGSVHLHATDGEGEWLIRFSPDGVGYEHGHAKGDVAVRGPLGDLVLWVYGRLGVAGGGVDVVGDAAVAARWLDASALA